MIPGGYILQPRCFDLSKAAHLSPVTRELWFYLLRRVNHKDNCKFKRGQGFFSLGDIQNDLSWTVGFRKMTYSKPQLVKALRRLREGNMVETMKATRGISVTVCNYSLYQDAKQYEGNDEGTTKEQRRKHEGTHLKQECKNEKKTDIPTELRPGWFPPHLWESFLSNRKHKKLQNSHIALNAICKKLQEAITDGYSIEDCVVEYVSGSWQKFDVSWMKNKPKEKTTNEGWTLP